MDLDEKQVGISTKKSRLILINVCVGQFIVGLDQRALLVALPTLSAIFNTSLTTIQWVLFIYDLTLIGLVITVGRLGRFVRPAEVLCRRIFDLRSAVPRSAAWLNPQHRSFYFAASSHRRRNDLGQWQRRCFRRFPPGRRGKALGLHPCRFTSDFLPVPRLGGLLIDTIGWRWIFFINLPVGLWAAWLAWRIIEESKEPAKTNFD